MRSSLKLTMVERLRALRQDPTASVRTMGVSEGLKVADIGAGIGYFTVPAALVVGPAGLVYSVEPDAVRSARISKRVAAEGLQNVQVLTTGAEQLGAIATGSLDVAFSAFSFHHFSDRQAALAELRRVLHADGSFYVWDRVPGLLVRHGTRRDELGGLAEGFARFEPLGAGKTVRARFTK